MLARRSVAERSTMSCSVFSSNVPSSATSAISKSGASLVSAPDEAERRSGGRKPAPWREAGTETLV